MNNAKDKKNIGKVLKRIKWENIYFIISLVLSLIQLVKHSLVVNSGLLLIEMIFLLSFNSLIRYAIKDIRKNFIEYKNLFLD